MAVGVFVVDLKNSFLSLCQKGFLATRLKDLPWNPLEHIPGTDIENHCFEVGQQLSSAYYLLNSGTIFSRILLDMFRKNGQPTLNEFKQEIHKLKAGSTTGLNYNQVSAVKGRLDQLNVVLGDRVCNTRHGFLPHRHAQDKIVFSLNTGCPNANALFSTWLPASLYLYNIAHNIRPDKL
jgi:hypothetical protein